MASPQARLLPQLCACLFGSLGELLWLLVPRSSKAIGLGYQAASI